MLHKTTVIALLAGLLAMTALAFTRPTMPAAHQQAHALMSAIVSGQTVGIDSQTFTCHVVASPPAMPAPASSAWSAPLGTMGR